jgi:hypothetical protein
MMAARERSTMRVLIIEGLRQIIAEHRVAPVFRLRNASFRGNGLQPDVAGAGWAQIRAMAYDKRGG